MGIIKQKQFKLTGYILLIVIILSLLSACSDTKENNPEYEEAVLSVSSANVEEEDTLETEDYKAEHDRVVNIKAIGDVMLGRGVAMRLNGDFIKPFIETADFLNSADITFANLECSISSRGTRLIGKGYWLQAPYEALEGVLYAGIDIVNIANNHILDFNEIAMTDTIEALQQNNIKYIGAGANLNEARQSVVFDIEGTKVGFLGYSDFYQYGYGIPGQKELRYLEATDNISGIAPLKFDLIEQDIINLRESVDYLIISLHWGVEESHHVPEEQREFAYKILDAGADAILGHHPHQLQGIEIYNGKPIIYSMGNFIFDQNDKENNETVIIDMDIKNDKVIRLEAIPAVIKGKTQTIFAKDNEAEHILTYMKKLSEQLGTEVDKRGLTLNVIIQNKEGNF